MLEASADPRACEIRVGRRRKRDSREIVFAEKALAICQALCAVILHHNALDTIEHGPRAFQRFVFRALYIELQKIHAPKQESIEHVGERYHISDDGPLAGRREIVRDEPAKRRNPAALEGGPPGFAAYSRTQRRDGGGVSLEVERQSGEGIGIR